MLNLNELERRWLHYKIKSYIPHVTISLSLIIIISVLYSFSLENTEEKKKVIADSTLVETKTTIKKPKNIEPVIKKEEHIKVVKKEIINRAAANISPVSDKENTKLVISPSLDFMRNINENSPHYYTDQEEEKTITYNKPSIKEPVVEVEEIQTEVVENNTVSIKRQNTQDDIQHVIKRFKKSNNPALSLFIAKKYYELENYNQAYNYALITNEINNDIEESWIIFAKSLVKLNKQSRAIDTLKKYIDHSHSNRAQILLDNIKSGKIK